MATAVQKITPSASRDIPFDKLSKSRLQMRDRQTPCEQGNSPLLAHFTYFEPERGKASQRLAQEISPRAQGIF
jgi:hypothetical protein